jgi:c-di-GMP-binding flagellar brake protein YcgR
MTTEPGPDRRRHPRANVGGRTKGKVNSTYDVSLLDISLGGALIEHVQVVQPNTVSQLGLTLQGHKMKLKCRVVRSLVHRSEGRGGGRKLIYRTGLEFLDVSDEAREAIGDYIRSIIEEESERDTKGQDPLQPLDRARLHPSKQSR